MATKRAATWASETVQVKMKGSGMGALAATKLRVVMPDGRVASKQEQESLVVWPSVRLRVSFGESVNWYGKAKGRWHDAAVALVMGLAPLASPKWIVQDIIGRNDVPVLKPVAVTAAEAKKLVGRALFDHTKDHAWVCLRSGGERDVTWDACALVTQHGVQLHLRETDANVARLEQALDQIVADAPFAWAGVGYGWDGWASARALARDEAKPKTSYGGVSLRTLAQLAPNDGVDWLVWLGRAWCTEEGLAEEDHEELIAPVLGGKGRSVAREDALARVAVARPLSPSDAKGAQAGEALGAELAKVVAKARVLSRRAALRKRR